MSLVRLVSQCGIYFLYLSTIAFKRYTRVVDEIFTIHLMFIRLQAILAYPAPPSCEGQASLS